MLIRRFAKNWISITVRIRNHEPGKIFLRNGLMIDEVKDLESLIKLLSLGWKVEENSESFVVLKNQDDIKLKCRLKEGFDLGHILEIFESSTYLQDLKDSTIIDVGASTADSSVYFAVKGAKVVFGLEPMKESFDIATYNVNINNLESKVHLINAALSYKTGRVEMIVSSQNPNANSINPTETVRAGGINFDSKRVVETISLKDIVSQFSLIKIDLLKMDCEGCEYEVLQGLDEETYSRIDSIILEFHDGIKFLADLLEEKGYNVRYDRPIGLGILKASRNIIKAD
jgi:FkbM family methyltransferase